jgi:hypothetical protein
MFCSCFVVIVVLCIFVCTSAGLLTPGESPIAVRNNDDDYDDNDNNNNNNNNKTFFENLNLIKIRQK